MPTPQQKRLLLLMNSSGGSTPDPYLLHDDFPADVAAPLPATRSAQVGRLVKAADVNGRVSITGRVITAAAGDGDWITQGYYWDDGSAPYTRKAGRTYHIPWLRSNTGQMILGLYPSTTIQDTPAFGIHVSSASIEAREGSASAIVATSTSGAGYSFWLVDGGAGNPAYLYYMGGAEQPLTPVLLWVFANNAATNLFAGFANFDQAFNLGNMRMKELAGNFGTANALLAGSLNGTLVLNATFTCPADCVVKWTETTRNTASNEGIALRYVDANNKVQIYSLSTGVLRVSEVVAGTPANHSTASGTVVSGSKIVVRIVGAAVQAYVDGVRVLSFNLASPTTQTGGIYDQHGTSGVLSNLTAYGVSLSGGDAALLLGMMDTSKTAYVDTVLGNDSNTGMFANAPKLTYAAAITALDNASVHRYGNISIIAPQATPAVISQTHVYSFGNYALNGPSTWYGTGSITTFTSGWTSDGGGVYHRTIAGTPFAIFVPTLTDSNGFQVILNSGGATSTPVAGTFGQIATTLYVHLPGDVSPNSNTLIQPLETINLWLQATTRLSMSNAIFRYGNSVLVRAAGSSVFTGIDSTFEYSYDTCVASDEDPATLGTINMTRCIARRAWNNDGFASKGLGTSTLTNCEGAYNGDEGASPHHSSTLRIIGGHYHHNAHGGCTSTDQSQMIISGGVLVDYNYQAGVNNIEGAICFATDSGGSIDGATCSNNLCPGVHIMTTGTVTIANLTSGLAQGNSYADIP